MKQLGLFGGSFNPIHNGHLHLVRAVKRAMQLDGVVLMPTGEAPHKSSAEYAPAADRLEMCRLAAEKYRWLQISDYEIRKNGKSYTVETLRALCSEDFSVTHAARRLYIHRTTFQDRMDRIRALTGLDPEDEETRFLLQFGFRLCDEPRAGSDDWQK